MLSTPHQCKPYHMSQPGLVVSSEAQPSARREGSQAEGRGPAPAGKGRGGRYQIRPQGIGSAVRSEMQRIRQQEKGHGAEETGLAAGAQNLKSPEARPVSVCVLSVFGCLCVWRADGLEWAFLQGAGLLVSFGAIGGILFCVAASLPCMPVTPPLSVHGARAPPTISTIFIRSPVHWSAYLLELAGPAIR